MPEPDACAFCGFETSELYPYPSRAPQESALLEDPKESHHWLCQLCAATPAGNACDFPDQYTPGEVATMKCICFLANAMLAEIRQTRKS